MGLVITVTPADEDGHVIYARILDGVVQHTYEVDETEWDDKEEPR